VAGLRDYSKRATSSHVEIALRSRCNPLRIAVITARTVFSVLEENLNCAGSEILRSRRRVRFAHSFFSRLLAH